MNTVTIPKTLTRGEELVIVPRKEYEAFSQWRKTTEQLLKFKTFKPTSVELKDLKKAREEHKRGAYVVIKNRADLERELGIAFKRTR